MQMRMGGGGRTGDREKEKQDLRKTAQTVTEVRLCLRDPFDMASHSLRIVRSQQIHSVAHVTNRASLGIRTPGFLDRQSFRLYLYKS